MRRGEVWLVSLNPTQGSEIGKARPSIIIQNDIGNTHSSTTIVVPITSQKTDRIYPVEVLVTPTQSGLPKTSKALCDQIRCIDKQRLIKRIGKLNATTVHDIEYALKVSLGMT
ncbi:type II toxin-antitoxin system PemK/MazF family toxin [Candidatus Woesearchaeota archaeon]|nr:type II toxin-antitoxin system PemK/MazF family toxin [Candidatus Woesearchaeota archaeon]